mmetsp:Transcript_26217/g.59463  ORF Transcript_26217/g.59463 Transcript_26217/m.59463 type:complete len:211 (+) Transcript_26217:131-763(+)
MRGVLSPSVPCLGYVLLDVVKLLGQVPLRDICLVVEVVESPVRGSQLRPVSNTSRRLRSSLRLLHGRLETVEVVAEALPVHLEHVPRPALCEFVGLNEICYLVVEVFLRLVDFSFCCRFSPLRRSVLRSLSLLKREVWLVLIVFLLGNLHRREGRDEFFLGRRLSKASLDVGVVMMSVHGRVKDLLPTDVANAAVVRALLAPLAAGRELP